jgi:uncharacterized protein (TIGR03435 family)
MKAVLLTVSAVASLGIAHAHGQSPLASPMFEVATVRQNTGLSDASRISGPTPGRFTITNVPLVFILHHAYQALAHQLVGAPDWVGTTAYDITATYPPGTTPTDAETRVMLQQLLGERFRLKVRREQRELPVYRLVMARSDKRLGPQLVRSEVDCEQWLAEKRPQVGAGGPSPVPGGRRPACTMTASRKGFLTGGTRTIAQLMSMLQPLVGRPLVDATGLSGTFDIDLVWTESTDPARPQGANADAGVSLFTALQEQLGLRLESGRSAFDVVAIEHIERPTPD